MALGAQTPTGRKAPDMALTRCSPKVYSITPDTFLVYFESIIIDNILTVIIITINKYMVV